jgi:hypothetical protein
LKNNDFFTRKLTLGTFIRIKWFDIDPNIRSGVDKGVLDDPEQIYNEMFQKLCMVQTLELEPGNSEVYLAFKKGLAYQINKLNYQRSFFDRIFGESIDAKSNWQGSVCSYWSIHFSLPGSVYFRV